MGTGREFGIEESCSKLESLVMGYEEVFGGGMFMVVCCRGGC